MKIQSVFAFASLVGLTSAQDQNIFDEILSPFLTIAIPLIFNIFAGGALDVFNDMVSTALENFDPFEFDFEQESKVTDKVVDGCGDEKVPVYAVVKANEAVGLSTMVVNSLEMTDFELNSEGSTSGFSLDAEGGTVSVLLGGTMGPKVEDCANSENIDFNGTLLLDSPFFKFGLDGEVKLFGDLEVSKANITDFEFSWEDLTVNFTDLGDYSDIADSVQTTLISIAEDLANTVINKDFLQDAIDTVLPFP